MKKSAFATVALLLGLSLIVNAADKELLGLVPRDVDGVFMFDMHQILNHPKCVELMEGPDLAPKFLDFRKDMEANGIDIRKTAKHGVVFLGNMEKPDATALIKAELPENKFVEIARSSAEKEGRKLESETVDGHIVYSFTDENGKSDSFAGYITENIIAFGSTPEKITDIFAINKSNNLHQNKRLSRHIEEFDENAVLWGVFNMSHAPPAPGDPAGAHPGMNMNPADSISGGAWCLSLKGEEKKDIDLTVKITCWEAKKAQALSMQANGILIMGISALFANDAALGQELMQTVNFNVQDRDMLISALLPGELFSKLVEYGKNADNMMSGPRGMGGAPDPDGGTEFLPPPPPLEQ